MYAITNGQFDMTDIILLSMESKINDGSDVIEIVMLVTRFWGEIIFIIQVLIDLKLKRFREIYFI